MFKEDYSMVQKMHELNTKYRKEISEFRESNRARENHLMKISGTHRYYTDTEISESIENLITKHLTSE